MVSEEKLFGNHFDEEKITDTRLANFAEDCLNRFKAIAIEGQYATTIAELTTKLQFLQEDISDVDTGKNKQRNKTLNVDEFITNFKRTMSSVEGVIAFKSGKTSAVYMELYPDGVYEYTSATKTKMTTLMDRVENVVTAYETALGEDLTGMLSSLKTHWQTLRAQQEQQMMKVSDSRVERSEARQGVELALHNASHMLAQTFPFDVAQCASFFNFRLLYGVKHHEEETAPEAVN
jgi:hypothetical protein